MKEGKREKQRKLRNEKERKKKIKKTKNAKEVPKLCHVRFLPLPSQSFNFHYLLTVHPHSIIYLLCSKREVEVKNNYI
jgi:hypothetical protein